MCICKLLDFNNKYKGMVILGFIFFVSICILLYYSITIFDYISFAICAFVNAQMIFYVRNKVSKEAIE